MVNISALVVLRSSYIVIILLSTMNSYEDSLFTKGTYDKKLSYPQRKCASNMAILYLSLIHI